MKKHFVYACLSLLWLLILPGAGLVFSQNNNPVFGMVSLDELQMNRYAPDPAAEALVISDKGLSFFIDAAQGGYNIIYERSTRIKIFNEAGYRYAQVEIPYYNSQNIFERIFDFEAYTYNINEGSLEKIAFNTANSYDEKINDNWNVRKIALPGVKEGSVIEYRYKIESEYIFQMREWNFQWPIPVLFSQYETRMIPLFAYAWLLQGASKFDSYETFEYGTPRQYNSNTYRDLVHKFVMKNLPAFRDDDFITSSNDYVIKLIFQLQHYYNSNGAQINIVTTWDQMVKDLLKDQKFGKYLNNATSEAKKMVKVMDLQGMSEEDKTGYIVNYIKNNYSWNGRYSVYTGKSAKNFLNDKHGSSSEINLMLTAMLRAAGIEAYPLLVSTRSHGKIKYDYPFFDLFNSVLVAIPHGTSYKLADATEPLSRVHQISVGHINDKGMVVNKNSHIWLPLNITTPSVRETKITTRFQEGIMQSQINISASFYDALALRRKFGKDEQKIVDDWANNSFLENNLSVSISNYDKPELPYIIQAEVSSPANQFADKLIIMPFLREVVEDNPFKHNQRRYPIDMIYPVMKKYFSEIEIPEGYEVEHLPAPLVVHNENFMLEYSAVKSDGKIMISMAYSYNKDIYAPATYVSLKAFTNDLIRKGNERIVLVKPKN